ncbi:MAG TPA: hypothetical protein VLN59_01030 [Burkholderiales bacterium]|nr:hypothetical protein [Burkholderiales bacterium]
MHSQLVELGQKALAAVASSVARGAPLLYCQLLASEFYEALRRELRNVEDAALSAAVDGCRRAGRAGITPNAMLIELQSAIAMLQLGKKPAAPSRPSRPVLRVIQGGLSR